MVLVVYYEAEYAEFYTLGQRDARKKSEYTEINSSCCGKQKPTMSPLRKQGSRAKKLDSRFRGNDKYCFRNSN